MATNGKLQGWINWMKLSNEYFETRGTASSLQVRQIDSSRWVAVTVNPQVFTDSVASLTAYASEIWPEVTSELALYRLLFTNLWEHFESTGPENVSAVVEMFAHGFRGARNPT